MNLRLSAKRQAAQKWLRDNGFTLIEMIAAMTVFALLLGFFLVLAGGAQRAWMDSEAKVELYQNSRAVLELISREIAPAIVSTRYQFVQTPNLSLMVTGPAPYLLATNAPSLFWIAPNPMSGNFGPCEFGYFLTRYSPSNSYALNRFFVTPDNSQGYSRVVGTNAVTTNSVMTVGWIATTPSSAFARTETTATGCVSAVAEGVVAMWIRCFDAVGNPIPWLSQNSLYSAAAPLQFNSAAAFQMASQTDSAFSDESTFQYTAPPPSTLAANRLPSSVEITLIMVDSRTLAKNPQIPEMPPAPADPSDIPAQIEAYHTSLTQAGIKTARIFTSRIPLANSKF